MGFEIAHVWACFMQSGNNFQKVKIQSVKMKVVFKKEKERKSHGKSIRQPI